MKNTCIWLLMLVLFSLQGISQDEVLLTIDNKPFLRSEFERIYHKNNNVPGYESKSVEEYLDLFINFKLKVLEAERLGYDTLKTFITELAGYREQLAKPYLQDRQVMEQQLQEAYNRSINEVNASHIMVKLPASPSPQDTVAAYEKILKIRNRVLAGESFDKIAREESDDHSARVNDGRLGWFSAFAMVFPFEQAAYQTATGELSLPVRSRFGYHLIRVNGKRPSPGEIKLAHIMTRAARNEKQETIDQAKDKIYVYYKSLQSGEPFGETAAKYSEDAGSAKEAGLMRWLRSGELPPEIEEMVYALKDSGTFTPPVQSDYGWHIFQLVGKRPLGTFEQMKPRLEERIMMDERGKRAEQAVISRIKKESGFVLYPENVEALAALMDSSVYTGQWDINTAGDLIEPVFSFGGKEYTQKDLAAFVLNARRYAREESLGSIVDKKCNELVNKELLEYEKDRLEGRYPEFNYLMEEYHDGILLFNITDDTVWSKAVSDTAGLKAFHARHFNEYTWQERADISVYKFSNKLLVNTVKKYAKKRASQKWTPEEMTSRICPDDTIHCIAIKDGKYEKDDKIADKLVWEKGSIKKSDQSNIYELTLVNAIIPPMPKTFDEVRGQVTADYQNFLDRKWIEALRARYAIAINRDVLTLVK